MKEDFRSVCFKILFSSNIDIDNFSLGKNELSENQIIRAEQLILNSKNQYENIKNLIIKYSDNWNYERIAKTEKISLILGISELSLNLTPLKVIVSEWTKLTDKHSSSEGAKFVNAILDMIGKNEFKN
jgi:transcription termination factor NusB